MKAIRTIFIVTSLSLLLSACSILPGKKAGLNVISNVPASVLLDGKEVGQTPYDGQELAAKKYQLKIQPTDQSYVTEEATVRLGAGVQSAVDWSFAKTADESKGIILELENSQKKGASELEIVTTPDHVPILIDNESKGFSPLLVDTLKPGQYSLSFQAPGYEQFTRTINLLEGKRVVVTVKLAKKMTANPVATDSAQLQEATASATPSAKATPKATPKPTTKPVSASGSATLKKPYIEVQDTPTGFLRVRETPATTGKELGQLNVGDTVPYAGETQSGWYKITYKAATSSAWVSAQYAKLVQ